MSLRAGSVDAFSGSLAAEIDSAFKALVLATKGEPLEQKGEQDRWILFAAIAQGVLAYLGANDGQFAVDLRNLPAAASATIRLPVPRISVSPIGSGGSSTARVYGYDFPTGTATVRWKPSDASGGSVVVPSSGNFTLTLARPAGLASGPQALVARSSSGDEVAGQVTL
jgi:hypothetical protein